MKKSGRVKQSFSAFVLMDSKNLSSLTMENTFEWGGTDAHAPEITGSATQGIGSKTPKLRVVTWLLGNTPLL
jgi:hypothetical protein